jgi:hypothetical protein
MPGTRPPGTRQPGTTFHLGVIGRTTVIYGVTVTGRPHAGHPLTGHPQGVPLHFIWVGFLSFCWIVTDIETGLFEFRDTDDVFVVAALPDAAWVLD